MNRRNNLTSTSNKTVTQESYPPDASRASSNVMNNSQGQWKKLFIGQIPKSYSEQDVVRIFEGTCPVLRAHIIYDRYTGEHKGCAFIYVDASVAETVKQTFHNKYICSNMTTYMQVKDAISSYRHSPHSGGNSSYSSSQKNVSSKQSSPSSEPIKSDSPNPVNQNETPNQNVEYEAPPSTQPTSLPAIYPVQYYSVYPQNFFMTPNPQAVMTPNTPMQPTQTTQPTQPTPSTESSSTLPESNVMMPVPSPIPMLYPSYPGMNYVYPTTASPENPETTDTPPTVAPIAAAPPAMTAAYPYPMMPFFNYGEGGNQVPMVMGSDGLMYPLSNYVNDGTYPSSSYASPSRPHRMSPANANLFVFNIPSDFKDADLENLFKEFGDLINAKVILDRETKVSKGYGFVNFGNEEDAEKAIKAMNGKVIQHKRITVQVKKPRAT